MFSLNCVGADSPDSRALHGSVCGTDGVWYRPECALLDTAPMNVCPIFPEEPCE